MSQSSLLRLADVRAVFQLVGECREVGDDPFVWRRHLLAETARLAGAAVANEYEGVFLDPFRITGIVDWGFDTSGFERSYFDEVNEEFARRGGGFNPMLPAYFAARQAGRGPCLRRSDMLPDAPWYSSRYYQDYHGPSGADVMMYCIFPVPGSGGDLSGFVLIRPLGDRDFTSRQKALVQKLHEQITALINGPLAGFHEPSPSTLLPRVRQTLQCLLEGDSDKQIAARLDLSRYTVNQYTKVIFAHFGVSSRTELLARWIRRGWGNRRAWSDPVRALHVAQPSPPNPSLPDLTPRVQQTLQCLLEGDSDKQAARRLGLSRHTVNQYTKVIFAHFGVSSRAELLARWIRRGWGNKCAWVNPL